MGERVQGLVEGLVVQNASIQKIAIRLEAGDRVQPRRDFARVRNPTAENWFEGNRKRSRGARGQGELFCQERVSEIILANVRTSPEVKIAAVISIIDGRTEIVS